MLSPQEPVDRHYNIQTYKILIYDILYLGKLVGKFKKGGIRRNQKAANWSQFQNSENRIIFFNKVFT